MDESLATRLIKEISDPAALKRLRSVIDERIALVGKIGAANVATRQVYAPVKDHPTNK